jgi:hypothetical protein
VQSKMRVPNIQTWGAGGPVVQPSNALIFDLSCSSLGAAWQVFTTIFYAILPGS